MKKFIILLLIVTLVGSAAMLLKKRRQSIKDTVTPTPLTYQVKVVPATTKRLEQTRLMTYSLLLPGTTTMASWSIILYAALSFLLIKLSLFIIVYSSHFFMQDQKDLSGRKFN